jgi:hypothetical protein
VDCSVGSDGAEWRRPAPDGSDPPAGPQSPPRRTAPFSTVPVPTPGCRTTRNRMAPNGAVRRRAAPLMHVRGLRCRSRRPRASPPPQPFALVPYPAPGSPGRAGPSLTPSYSGPAVLTLTMPQPHRLPPKPSPQTSRVARIPGAPARRGGHGPPAWHPDCLEGGQTKPSVPYARTRPLDRIRPIT